MREEGPVAADGQTGANSQLVEPEPEEQEFEPGEDDLSSKEPEGAENMVMDWNPDVGRMQNFGLLEDSDDAYSSEEYFLVTPGAATGEGTGGPTLSEKKMKKMRKLRWKLSEEEKSRLKWKWMKLEDEMPQLR